MNLNNFPLGGHSTFYFYPNLVSDGHLLYFHFLALINNAAMKFVYKFLCEHMFSFLSNIYLGVKLLFHMVTLCLTF